RGAVFAYEAEYDTYRCPAGKELRRRGIARRRVGVLHHVYQAQAADCRRCAYREKGCGGAAARRIFRSENVPVVTAFVEKMQTEAAQVIYRLRGAVAEFPNAGLKAKIGLRQFRVRRRYLTKRSRPNDAGAWKECLSLCTRLQERKRRCE